MDKVMLSSPSAGKETSGMSSEAKVAKKLELKEVNARIKQLEDNIAKLKKLEEDRAKLQAKATPKKAKDNKTKGKIYTRPMAAIAPAQSKWLAPPAPAPKSSAPPPGTVDVVGTAGILVGGAESVASGVVGVANIANNTILQIGDILTGGLNHDSPLMQQVWAEQGALGSAIVKLVTEPGQVISGFESSAAARLEAAEALRAAGENFEAARVEGKLGADVAQAVFGGVSAVRALSKLSVAILAESGPRAGSLEAQRGSIGVPKTSGATILKKKLFANQLPEKLAGELAEARSLGVKPIKVGDPAFEAIVNDGPIKFVVTESGELLIAPYSVNGIEISHAVLSNGRPVLAAGQANIAGVAGEFIGIDIVPHSGHFLNGATAVESFAVEQIGIDAFGRVGIKF